MPNSYHVLIAGAGPAGAMLAWKLARQGLKVLIIDRARLPRYKTCGGGLTARAKGLIPFDISPVMEVEARTAVVAVDYRPVFQAQTDQPLVYTVMRDRFDYFLVQQAVKAGAELIDQTAFRSVDGPPGNL
ncbi:MAG: FAD-dependent monooxygenase, partial [Deltaproteobacteria bacterium]|nr:FAD-dependent monooxygenase [Deltaproteobacteria bacterium]